jgi:DNA-directed RNA polymerase subunit alpha
MEEKELLSVRNLGQKSMEEIRDRLIERGYIPKGTSGGNMPAIATIGLAADTDGLAGV